ncbi:MAG TPA: MFS transporter, partial [Parachlamydiales bacterium]|nr:MFS transporter [Parachlamydiales bacterium]
MKTEESYAHFALLTLFIASMGPLLFGYNTAIISGAILFLQESFSLTLLDKGMVVSIILLGAMAGAFAS